MTSSPKKMIDLFAGIGGFSLAGHSMGYETIAFVEKDKKCKIRLNKNFPGIPVFNDINLFDAKPYNGTVDIICGGFPCQPFSDAGLKKGENDERYLWPSMFRVIRESQPSWVIGENVNGLVNMDDGRTLEKICTDLESEGYEVQPFIIPAGAAGAWHRRKRIWILAYSHSNQHKQNQGRKGETEKIQGKHRTKNGSSGLPGRTISGISSNGSEKRIQGNIQKSLQELPTLPRFENGGSIADLFNRSDIPEPLLCGNDYGISEGLDRVAMIGNAFYPPLVKKIFEAIEIFESQIDSKMF